MKRLLCIRLPGWPIQRLVVAQPELNGRAIILHAHDARRGQCVWACSRAAYRCGVRPRMSLAEATSLQQHAAASLTAGTAGPDPAMAQTPGGLEPYIAQHDPQADDEQLRQLAEWCEQFSPLVGFEHLGPLQRGPEAPEHRSDCLYIEATDLADYFGSEQALARLVAASFTRRGYVARVAIADTLGAAWALAHFALQQATIVTSPVGPACGAGQRQPPTARHGGGQLSAAHSSFLVVPPGATWTALQSLPVQALRLPPPTLSLLQQLGITAVGQLAALPRSSLLARFGEVLLLRLDQACGRVDEVLLAHHRTPQFQTSWQLEHPTTNRSALHSILGQLLERLTVELRQRGEGVLQCICRLSCTPAHIQAQEQAQPSSPPSACAPLTLRIGLFQPTANARHLQQLLQMQWERLRLPGPVDQLAVEAVLTAPLERRQRELFSDSRRQAPRQLAQLVDRLSSRLGASNVVRARLHADAQPEFAFRYLPLTGNGYRRSPNGRRRRTPGARRGAHASGTPRHRGRKTASTADRSSSVRRRLIRPLHLRCPPLPLDVVALAPDGPPVQLLFARQNQRVVRCWGPERIETGWWRGHSVRRDYYRLETDTGHWFWVFRQLRDGNWFLHGMFT